MCCLMNTTLLKDITQNINHIVATQCILVVGVKIIVECNFTVGSVAGVLN